MRDAIPHLRKPDWLKVRLPGSHPHKKIQGVFREHRLHSVCQEARCPNIAECFHDGTATFLILGDTCTRACRYCNVAHGVPVPPDPDEPSRLVEAVQALGLQYIVITSVTRDDLGDGGATHFAACIAAIREQVPGCRVEVLIPDFQGNRRALVSLELLRRISDDSSKKIVSKSGFMVGFGESHADILELMEDLAGVHCERLTFGQYQQPTRKHWPVRKYYHPDEFEALKEEAAAMGFRHVEAGPLVRSSYHADGAGIERE
jgi:lipoic acid synthetase